MRKHDHQTAQDAQADIEELRCALYKVVERNATGLSVVEVIRAMKDMSEEMYGGGIDESMHVAVGKIKNWDNIASAWDLMWLTLWATRLKMLQNKKKKPV